MTTELPAHARLGASSAERWLTCTRSVALEETFPDEESPYAAEGTAAHELAEARLRERLGEVLPGPSFEVEQRLTEEGYFDPGFSDHVDVYVDLVLDLWETYDRPIAKVEARVPFDTWVPEGFGTADAVLITGDTVHVVDLKFGQGVPVAAEKNPQLRLYALGAATLFSDLLDESDPAQVTVRYTICQPRLNSVSTEETALSELLGWAEDYVKPRAALAAAGEGEFVPSEKACRFCKARAVCKARAERNLETAQSEFAAAPADVLTLDDLSELLPRLAELKAWIGDVESYAFDRALKHGEPVLGFKIVRGRGSRAWAENVTDVTLTSLGLSSNDVLTAPALRSPAQVEKALGKKKFHELAGDLVIKHPGKPTLVPEDDPRQELDRTAEAVADFS